MILFNQIEDFLIRTCPSLSPLLLALSGGPDSLCLFYALLLIRERHGIPFHVAHVDHRWRQESQQEAEALHQLALQHQVPFHLKVLDPAILKGNLELACREERYDFFAQLCKDIPFQGVLTGHHQDDQAETVFKRLLEGTHWSRWEGLQQESVMKGVRVLRPLLGMTKKDIQQWLTEKNLQAFEDPSNRHLQFLRARLRETIFPRLNKEFGKRVQNSLITLGEEARELREYFDCLLVPLLDQMIEGPWGSYLDLQRLIPHSLLEVKYLLRLICQQKGFFLSRDIIEQAAQSLYVGKANQLFVMGTQQIWMDRRRIFILSSNREEKEDQFRQLSLGTHQMGRWKIEVVEANGPSHSPQTSWKEAWKGHLQIDLPIGNYQIGIKKILDKEIENIGRLKKQWNQAKVPAFLYYHFPLIWEGEKICHEFLTGKFLVKRREGTPHLKIKLTYQ